MDAMNSKFRLAMPGGEVIDPSGPSSNPMGLIVTRGGSYDFEVTDCRSARRFFSLGNDTDLGFRVVLMAGMPSHH